MTAYYNEIDPFAAEMLRNLIAAGHIAHGIVDERSIEDVQPDELAGYTQCHFFAGVGVWSLALRNAGWPDDRPVWTGSCPCQPFSAAGKGAGFDDERHLWPHFFHLISQRKPAIVLGEQVAAKAVEPWIDLVHADLEALGYAFGCVPFPSAGVGAPHIRDRAYWVANSQGNGHQWAGQLSESARRDGATHLRSVGGLADADKLARGQGCADTGGWDSGSDAQPRPGLGGGSVSGAAGPTNGLWADADWIFCRDGKWRPVEPGTFPLVTGAPARVGRLRAYGNAINAQTAQSFISSVMESV